MDITIKITDNGFIKMYYNGIYHSTHFYHKKDIKYFKAKGYKVIYPIQGDK